LRQRVIRTERIPRARDLLSLFDDADIDDRAAVFGD
jgi:hypothetical protein